ncbi:hypothetical protein [Nonomuraea glycinis]|uniref:hypothetical protein n=1 Tax=Nonomuraea glycinis TaxID=2047744 RepID=UPI002E149865|nr:hypothetical protein OHA68_11955 [Nonomuraea glycinis]
MRRGVEDDEGGPVAEWVWVDPQAWETNAAGGVTPAQRALITGPWVGPPVLGWVLVVTLVIIEGWAGWMGATTNGGFAPEGGWRGAVSMMAFITVVVGWQLVAGIWFWGVPAWGERYAYRKAIVDLAACRVGSAVGQIEVGPTGPQARADTSPGGPVAWGESGASMGDSTAWEESGAGLGGSAGQAGMPIGGSVNEKEAGGGPSGSGAWGDSGGGEGWGGNIPVPFGAPALPPPGPYRLYWLERGKRGRLLLSVRPLDE